MGLDQYAMVCDSDSIGEEEIDFATPKDAVEFFYWRKHPNLHGWMENLYIEKGGEQEFNCRAVRLTEIDLQLLETFIKENELPDTSGFFFGQSSGDEEEKRNDLEFIQEARAQLRAGKSVFYTSWW